MKFKGNGIIWNPEAKKPLVEFINGVFETEDPNLIKKLKELNVPVIIEDETQIVEGNTDNNEDFRKLRKLAKEYNIPGYMNMTKAELIEKLKGYEP